MWEGKLLPDGELEFPVDGLFVNLVLGTVSLCILLNHKFLRAQLFEYGAVTFANRGVSHVTVRQLVLTGLVAPGHHT